MSEALMKLIILGSENCRFCVAMKRAKTAEKFTERHDDVKLEYLTLPENWGDEDDDDVTAAEKMKIKLSRTESEKKAIKFADANDIQGIPFIAFADEKGEIIVAHEGAANLSQLSDLYQEALEEIGAED
jgi:thioredoxin-related protein